MHGNNTRRKALITTVTFSSPEGLSERLLTKRHIGFRLTTPKHTLWSPLFR